MPIGLFTHYVENYSIPEIIPPEKLFIAINFFIKSLDNKNITIRLSGCVNRSDINISEIQPPNDGPSGSWMTHIQNLFPSNKLHLIRKELHIWWKDVERLCQMSASQVEADSAKNRFFLYSKSQSTSYRQALEAGFHTSIGQQHLQEYEEYKVKCKQAAYCLSSAVLDTLFTEGEQLLYKLISSPNSFANNSTARRTENENYMNEVQESLKKCKSDLHNIFEKSLFRIANALESHEKNAWKAFYDRYTMGKMNEEQAASIAEDILRSSKARPKSTPGRGRRGGKSAASSRTRNRSADERKSSDMSDFSLFSVPSKPSRRSLSMSPQRQKHQRPHTSPSGASMISESSQPTNPSTSQSVRFSPFDLVTASLHPGRKLSRVGSPQRLNQSNDSNQAQPEPFNPSHHRASISIIQKSQNLMLNSVRNRLQARLELYRKDKIYNYFGTFIHQVIFQFQFLLFETATRYKMDQYLDNEYDRMMSAVERTARKDFVALSAVHSKEKVMLLNQGIVSDRGMWTGSSLDSPHSEAPSGRSEEKPLENDRNKFEGTFGDGEKLSAQSEKKDDNETKQVFDASPPRDPISEKKSPSKSPLKVITNQEELATTPTRHSFTGGTSTSSGQSSSPSQTRNSFTSTFDKPRLSYPSAQPSSSASVPLDPRGLISSASYIPTPTKLQIHELRFTELQQKHTAEINELEYRISEKKRSKQLQFNKMKYQTYQIMTNKLQHIRSCGVTADLSSTGVNFFNNICHIYQYLRSSAPYIPNDGPGYGPAVSSSPAGTPNGTTSHVHFFPGNDRGNTVGKKSGDGGKSIKKFQKSSSLRSSRSPSPSPVSRGGR